MSRVSRKHRGRRAVAGTLGTVLALALAATPAAAAAIPDAPSTPSVVPGNTAIAVTFAAPADDGGSPIVRYQATCTSSNGGAPGTLMNAGAVAPITVTGLTNGKTYTCTVAATNAEGTSPESHDSAAVIPATVPGAPAAPSVSADGTELTVSFNPPGDDGGRAITGYTASCGGGTVSTIVTATGPDSPIVVNGVRGTTYMCVVAATNPAGTGQPSAASAPVDIPALAPSTPARPTVERGNTKITVNVVPPANNGSAITGYTATCIGGFVPISKTSATPAILVSGLANGTIYSCKVTATNAIGTSPASAASLTVVPAAVPDAPARPTVVRGVGRIVVRFSAPAANGSAIKMYTASCASSNGGIQKTLSGPGAPITIGGVTNGRTYTCRVTATNIVGASPRSLPSVPIIPGTSPATPKILSVVSGKAPGPVGPLIVSFKPGSNNGTPISAYRATCAEVVGNAIHEVSSTGTPITLPGLVTGRDYSCRVAAISASGTSGPSAAIKARVGTPGWPKNVTISSKRPHGLSLSFGAPGNNGNDILRYRALCKSTNGGAKANQFARNSPFPVNGLTPGGRYTCRLTAINDRGEGPAAISPAVRLPF